MASDAHTPNVRICISVYPSLVSSIRHAVLNDLLPHLPPAATPPDCAAGVASLLAAFY